MREKIHDLVSAISPLDQQEELHRQDILDWIKSGKPLFRLQKPDIPAKHLVAYFGIIDLHEKKILLVDHIKAQRWLPAGGHVEQDEHPRTTAERELKEELKIELPLISPNPIFVSINKAGGLTPGHIDVNLWFAFQGNSQHEYEFDPGEFYKITWFPMDELPEKVDPHLSRFCKKVLQM